MRLESLNKTIREYTRQSRDTSNDFLDNTKQTEGSQYIVAFAAGDGTFMNVVKDIKSYGLVFWVLPFGTACDLSRTMGWGPSPSYKMRNNLEVLWEELCHATVVDFDIWEISVLTDDLIGNIRF